jgi:hypothetical protein
MSDSNYRHLSDVAICEKCRKPRLIWQPQYQQFICGWCRTEYTIEQALVLSKLNERQAREIFAIRSRLIKLCK